MDRSLGFGSMPCNSTPCSDSVSLRLRDSHPLTSLHVMTRRLILQKARRHPFGLRPLAGPWFQVLFHSPPGVLFTFPSQYFFAIAHWVVFRLRGWSPCLHTEFLVFRTTPDSASRSVVSLTRLSLSMVCLPIQFSYNFAWITLSKTPEILLLPV